MSHSYGIALPPLFPLLMADFEVSFTAMGLIMTLIAMASGIAQIPVGFLVDRLGARFVLVGGLALEAWAIGLMAVAPSIEWVFALAVVAGIGNSVFHPANYAIMSVSISSERMGRAFGLHTFAGHIGTAVTPMAITFLAVLWDWRMALVAVGVAGFLVSLAMITQAATLGAGSPVPKMKKKKKKSEEADAPAENGLALLFSTPMLLFFLFYVMTSMSSSGIRTFSVSAMVALFDTPLAAASVALSGFLFASAAGILVGGVIADRTSRHDMVAAVAFVVTAALIVWIGAVPLPVVALIALFSTAGLCQGIVRPARDMMVRAVTPEGAHGKVFGFVSGGINVGSALTPLLFGWIVDQGAVRWVFWLIAAFMVVALITVLVPKQRPAQGGTR
jgi:MFS family permease